MNMLDRSHTRTSAGHASPGAIAAAVVGLLILTAPCLRADRIFRRASPPLDSVQVISEDYNTVRYRRASGPEQTIETSKVERIEYDDTPDAYTEALAELDSGNFENAISDFRLAAGEKTKHDWIKEYASLGVARCQRLWAASQKSRYADAIASYKSFLKDHAKSRFYSEALFELGQCQSASGDAAAAVKTFDSLREWAFSQRVGVAVEVKALDAIGEAYLANGKTSEARSAYNRVQTFATAQADKAEDDILKAQLRGYADRARLKEGEILLAERKYREAEQFFAKLLNDASLAAAVRAAGLTGIGECQFEQNELKEAQLSFARAHVTYFNEKEQAAKAAYFLAKCALALGDREPDAAGKAKMYYTEVIERFADTSWAAKARQELNK